MRHPRSGLLALSLAVSAAICAALGLASLSPGVGARPSGAAARAAEAEPATLHLPVVLRNWPPRIRLPIVVSAWPRPEVTPEPPVPCRPVCVDVTFEGYTSTGSEERPWKTIIEGLYYAKDGDTVVVRPGIYHEVVWFSSGMYAARTVHLRSQMGPAVTIIDALGQGSGILVRNGNLTVDGFTVTNSGGVTAEDRCGIHVCPRTALGWVAATIHNNIVVGNGDQGGICVTSGTTYGQIEATIVGNRVIGNRATGIKVDVNDSVTGRAVIANNVVTSNSGYFGGGLFVETGAGNGKYPVDVFNNTVYANYGVLGGGLQGYSRGLTILNNIFFGNSSREGGSDFYFNAPPDAGHLAYNIVGGGQFAGQDGNIAADPWFVDPESGDFHLRRGSPAVDAGTQVDVAADFEGDMRPQDGDRDGRAGWDIGADEFRWLTE